MFECVNARIVWKLSMHVSRICKFTLLQTWINNFNGAIMNVKYIYHHILQRTPCIWHRVCILKKIPTLYVRRHSYLLCIHYIITSGWMEFLDIDHWCWNLVYNNNNNKDKSSWKSQNSWFLVNKLADNSMLFCHMDLFS